MKSYVYTLALFFIFIFPSCDFFKGKNEKLDIKKVYRDDGSLHSVYQYKDSLIHGFYKEYYGNGKLKIKMNYKNGKKEGKRSLYYVGGSEQSRIHYKNGVRHGKSIWFYKNGKPYRITNYKTGKKHGPRKKLYKDGKLMSVITYKDEHPVYESLKEYTNEGKLITDYPEIIVECTDYSDFNNKVILKFHLSNNAKDVNFFIKKKVKNDKEIQLPVRSINGKGYMDFYVPPNTILMKKLKIVAKTKTDKQNPFKTETIYNLAID